MNESDPPPSKSESTPDAPSDLPLAEGSIKAPRVQPIEAADPLPQVAVLGEGPPDPESLVAQLPTVPCIPLLVVALLGLMEVAIIAFDAWTCWSKPAIARLYYPLETSLLIVEREMELRGAARGAGPFGRALLWLGGDRPARDADELPKIYREVLRAPPNSNVAEASKPWLQAHLIVLLGELGQTNSCRAEVESFRKQANDSRFVAAVQRVYLFEQSGTAYSDLALATNSLSAGWTRDRFAARLTESEGRLVEARAIESELLAKGQVWYRAAKTALAIELVLVVTALALLVRAWRRRGIGWKRDPDRFFAPWPTSDGMAVLCGSLIASRVLVYLLLRVPYRVLYWIGGYWSSLLVAVPAMGFVTLLLLRPQSLRFGRHFGFEFSGRAVAVSLFGAIVITGLFIVGGQIVAGVIRGLGHPSHWTEGLDERLLYGNWLVRLTVLINMVLFAPFVEELLFRGILFGTLRKRLGPLAAASISSAVFAFIHFYSIPGLVAIFSFGFVCALAYERTRNLGVCIAGHMLTNLMIGLSEIALLG